MEDLITLDVRDDGVGFDLGHVSGAGSPPSPDPERGGYGLGVMRERIEGVAGTLAIESEPAGGTAISAAIPLVAPARPEAATHPQIGARPR